MHYKDKVENHIVLEYLWMLIRQIFSLLFSTDKKLFECYSNKIPTVLCIPQVLLSGCSFSWKSIPVRPSQKVKTKYLAKDAVTDNGCFFYGSVLNIKTGRNTKNTKSFFIEYRLINKLFMNYFISLHAWNAKWSTTEALKSFIYNLTYLKYMPSLWNQVHNYIKQLTQRF